MNKTFLLLLFFIPATIFGQQTQKIRNKKNNETFYVLKSNKSLKHGEYTKFSYNNKLLIKGFYNQGVKDSIWECYDLDGQLTLKYDYTKSEVVFYKPSDKFKYIILNDASNSDTTLSRPPIFLGGDGLFISEALKNTRYPLEAAENGKSGKVYVLFTIDKFGKPSNYRVEIPLGYGLDQEAIRVVKLVPPNWLPGLLNGQPIDVDVIYTINFSLK